MVCHKHRLVEIIDVSVWQRYLCPFREEQVKSTPSLPGLRWTWASQFHQHVPSLGGGWVGHRDQPRG